MPLTKTGKKVMASMMQGYGAEKGKQVFYAKAHEMGAKWHKSPDEYNDTALAETPPREKYARDPEIGSDAQPRAVGAPAGVRVADGTENLRVAVATHDAGITRRGPSGRRDKRPAGVRTFKDGVA